MKTLRITIASLLAALTICGITSCKTTEDNYRKAYEAAVEKQNEGFTEEELLSMTQEEAIPRTVYKGDSIPLKGQYVNTVKLDSTTVAAKRFNVVVATFKQRFNATSVYKRFLEAGYPDACLLIDKDQTYYVAAQTTNSLDDAVATLRALQSASPVPMRTPCPYILRKP
jgi:hypothetical protein